MLLVWFLKNQTIRHCICCDGSADRKRKSEAIRGTTMSKKGGWEKLFETLMECGRVGPVHAYIHQYTEKYCVCCKCVEEGRER